MNPNFIYGTAWKEELTEECVFKALSVGYRAIDTANQRKHYYEEGVGKALVRANTELGLKREQLFLQTKFTFARGQDHRKPYDEKAPVAEQVRQSVQSSLSHLGAEYLDSYLLHGPSTQFGLIDSDWDAWRAMEAIQRSGQAWTIGISNVSLDQLGELYEGAEIKPSFVQNRCFAETQWDREVRMYCQSKQISYQGFSLLTANREYLGGDVRRPAGRNVPQLVFSQEIPEGLHPDVQRICEQTGRCIEQIVFRFAQQIGMIPITGTRSEAHMRLDLDIADFSLSPAQLQTIENIAALN